MTEQPRYTRICNVALLVWVAFIWGHSLMSGDVSSAESGFFVGLLTPLFHAFGIVDEQLISFVVRKFAHFTEYLILGFFQSFGSLRESKLAYLLGPATALTDESIQLFVPGRAGMLRDVGIDCAGYFTGRFIGLLLYKLLNRKCA